MCSKKLSHDGHFTQQAFNSSAALRFNAMASGLMDNKLVYDRAVTNVSGNCSVRKTISTGYT